MKSKIIICLFFFMLLSIAYSEPSVDDFGKSIFNTGVVDYSLDKSEYSAGDIILTNFSIYNTEDFPLVDAYLVVEVVSGREHVYPSQSSEENNVLYEARISRINIGPLSKTLIPFSYRIPVDLKSGSYMVEAYLTSPRTPVVGLPQIFLSPSIAVFGVTGSGKFPYAQIMRTKTFFANETGPIGVGVNASSPVSGIVHISGEQSGISELLLNVTVCVWDDTSCQENGLFWNEQYPVDLSKNEADVLVSFNAPEKPDAYSIRLELLDNGRYLSLYRSRIVVLGETAKIRKAVTDKPSYDVGDKGRIFVLIGASPDHYTQPVTYNSTVSVYITDLEKNREVYRGTSFIPVLSLYENSGLIPKVFEFNSTERLRNFSVCSEVSSNSGMLYDKYCFIIDSSKIKPADGPVRTPNVSWTYVPEKNTLRITLCSPDAIEMKAGAFLLFPDKSMAAFADGLVLAPCAVTDLPAGYGKYALVVNDLETNKQNIYDVDILAGSEPSTTVPVSACAGGECDGGSRNDANGIYFGLIVLAVIAAAILIYSKRRSK